MSEGDQITTAVYATADLTRAQWDEIWTLTEEFFDVDRQYAEAELRRRQSIATFRMNDSLLGMAAIDVYPAEFRGSTLIVIHTSHVLIREAWRGRNLLQKLGARTFLATRLRHPLRPIYWFFDTFSYKSYLLLPRNFREYWPRHDLPTPEPRAALIHQLAADMYGPAWRPQLGVVARSGQKRMRASAAPLVLGPGSAPELEFFSRANPGHAEGDMLVCLCPLTLSNWLAVVRKALERLRRPGMH
ncbi:MAG TPA: hypothetical protein VFU13_02180 [Steroidobacteraceae bacterium]|nr:hypothetical protein [Steroidobacteraceae bacterium]